MFEYRLFTLLFLDGAITHFFNYLKKNKNKKERIQRSDSQFHEIREEEEGEIK